MNRGKVIDLYFTWLIEKVCDDVQRSDYEELLKELFNTEFVWDINRDENRAFDGLDLRSAFVDEYSNYISDLLFNRVMPRYCTVLEMMVALSIRCEELIFDSRKGDRTSLWFWTMIENMKLDNMDGFYFDEKYINDRLDIMMNRHYKRDGSDGALFTVKSCKEDFRKMEIWYQMNAYLNSINV